MLLLGVLCGLSIVPAPLATIHSMAVLQRGPLCVCYCGSGGVLGSPDLPSALGRAFELGPWQWAAKLCLVSEGGVRLERVSCLLPRGS